MAPLRTDRIAAAGNHVYALGVFALGVLCLVSAEPVLSLEPISGNARLWGFTSGAVLIALAAALELARTAGPARLILVVLLAVDVVALHVPKLIANPADGGELTVAFEVVAFLGAALVLLEARAAKLAGRILFGVSMLVFGYLHFKFHRYVSYVQPAWLPGHDFWTYFTGVAHVAAGLAILSGVKGRLGSVLAGVMFGLWVLMLHAPRVLAKPHEHAEWNSMFIAGVMCGGAWIVSGLFPRR